MAFAAWWRGLCPWLARFAIPTQHFLADPARVLALIGAAALSAGSLAQARLLSDNTLSLSQAVALAIQNSPYVATARADVGVARAATRSAQARLMPSLSANGFATSGSYGSIYSSSPAVDPAYSLISPSGSLIDGNVTLMVPVFTGGRLDAAAHSAASLESGTIQDLREVQGSAALRAEDAYLRALLALKVSTAAQSQVDASAELVRTTNALFVAGKGIEASVRQSEAELARARRQLKQAQGEVEKALLDLKAETGIDLDANVTLSDSLDAEVKADGIQVSLKTAMANRGLVLAARSRLQSAKADVGAAEGAERPQLYGVAMADVANESANRGASIGLTVSIPLFDGGARRAETSRARSARDLELAHIHEAEITVQKEVRQAYIDLATSEANVKSAEESTAAAKAAYEVVSLRVANGKGLLVEQLDALHALGQAQADLAESLYERRIAYARIRLATGEILQDGGK